MPELARRSFLCALGGVAGVAVGSGPARAQAAEPSPSERAGMDSIGEALVRKFDIPGLSVAIAHRGHLAYRQGFGFANTQTGEKVTPANLFRIASLSKPITSVAIFTLVERGRVKLEDKVFGPRGILGTDYGSPPYPPFVTDITVEHLLTHTSGGWPNNGNDPMFSHPAMSQRQLIGWALANQHLPGPPGERYAYSNFGYCVLGRVIEKLSGESYRGFVRSQVLERCGVTGMRIAGNTLAQRAPNEVVYYSHVGRDPYGMNVERMDSHGGWIASASDLVQFLVHVDGFATDPNILRPATLRTMTTPSAENASYAKGWAIRNQNWFHTGSLPGTTTLMVRSGRGLCWAILTNSRGANDFARALDEMGWQMVGQVKAWQG